jgi:hypothetical protein
MDYIKMKDFKKGIKDKTIIVYSAKMNYNSYGKFLFLKFKKDNLYCSGYTLGIHEMRNRKIMDIEINTSYELKTDKDICTFTGNNILSKQEILFILYEREQELKNEELQEDTEANFLFDELADICDDDGVLAMLEDYGFEF